ncbi:AtpZ/AtpI family protein [Nitrosomonas communis]|jgi:ATP synthase protein I|uniref:ATP synthase protein I n=1 Tax=Nitrosomonas communis TaxID=44574 RepID=A0A1I4K4J0_9PROT|nr:AtpZ/AtpI family protein [Nitrosomonas communis]SFL73396.1 ATP synthase protein I [Nitrosomonas communis]
MNNEQLRKSVERQVKRMQRAKQDRPTLLAQSIFLGTLSLLFILPIIVGAYLGNWLDDMAQGYSVHWTIGLLILGMIVGMVNVYLYVRKHD